MFEYFTFFVQCNDHFVTIGIASRLIVVIVPHRRGQRPSLRNFLSDNFYA